MRIEISKMNVSELDTYVSLQEGEWHIERIQDKVYLVSDPIYVGLL